MRWITATGKPMFRGAPGRPGFLSDNRRADCEQAGSRSMSAGIGECGNRARHATIEPGSGRLERRADRRIDLRLPIECRRPGPSGSLVVRTRTSNISSGGMFLELDSADFEPGDLVEVGLCIPPSEGIAAHPGRAQCRARVLRVQPLGGDADRRRCGVAACFLDRLRFDY